MGIAEKKSKQRLVQAPLRVPAHIREKAKSIAEEQSRGGVTVRETEVYREIIENFFAGEATTCSHKGIEKLA